MHTIEFKNLEDSGLNNYLTDCGADKFVILCDENTQEFCLEYLIANFEILSSAEIIEIPAGEESKCLDVAQQIWETLAEYGIGRNDVIINLGGGMITDVGGFIASTYLRGLRFVNIPTSLLGMIDASIGGKNGIDLGVLKNYVGTFNFPERLYIDTNFLETLAEKEIKNGFAELLKHALIADNLLAYKLLKIESLTSENVRKFVEIGAAIKVKIVSEDFKEQGIRANLNFGHTIGHAIESASIELGFPIDHGFAIGLGMRSEIYISVNQHTLKAESAQPFLDFLKLHFPTPTFIAENIDFINDYIRFDKKKEKNQVKFILLDEIGKASFGHFVTNPAAAIAFLLD